MLFVNQRSSATPSAKQTGEVVVADATNKEGDIHMQRGHLSALIMGLMSVTMAITAHTASFDCQQAATAIEQAICENPAANALDEQVGDLYAQLLKALPQAEAAELKTEDERAFGRIGVTTLLS